ncbi:MAG: hypothetical protein NC204_00200 [Candidatus Amulumruptor caecigallinarius]|nr:hypothetical protein [Candidatus Amulumruptor caecigallinarius]
MAGIKIAGVMRAGAYSPNHIGNDAAIFNAAANQLRKRGCEVTVYSEAQFNNEDISEDVILNMCRERQSIEKLMELEEAGRLVVNSGFGIENCTREKMTRMLLGNGIPYPESLIVNTNEDVRPELEKASFGPCWIKRGDFHAMHKEDVSYCRHIEEAQDVLHEYFYRGIHRAVINRHLVGDLVKFYGVSGQPFFYWFYPFDQGHSKYGYEMVNGKSQGFRFDVDELRATCQHASEIMDVKIYGGDCIIDSDGNFSIIDFNDWPSFAPCREEGGVAIAKCVMKAIKEWKK